MEKRVERHAEFEALRKHGMRWAVLLSLSFDLQQKKVSLPNSVNDELRTSRMMLESGCFSACNICCLQDGVEQKLVLEAVPFGREYLENWLGLLEKAMKGQLTPGEVKGLPLIKPMVTDCEFLRCTCDLRRILASTYFFQKKQ